MKNNKFIWISGSINSGKSTIASALHKKIKKSVNIELDYLLHFAKNDKLEDISHFIIKDALDLAKKWIGRGYLPVLTWPLIGEKDIDTMFGYSKELKLESIVINLIPEKESIKRNRGKRELTMKELNRIDYMYEQNVHKLPFGFSIDNSKQTIDGTMSEVMSIVNKIVSPYL